LFTMSNYGNKLDAAAIYSSIDDLEKSGLNMATSPLQQKANEVRANRVNWQSYLQSQMFSQEEYMIITKLDTAPGARSVQLLTEKPDQCARTFLNLMANISKEQTVQYIVTMIDDILQEDKSRVEIFGLYARKNRDSVFTPFLSMLNRPDTFTINQTSRIIAKLACWSKELMETRDRQYYLNWLKEQLKISGNEYVQTVARCLQMMLRIKEYRHTFVELDGVNAIVTTLTGKVGFQIQYQLTFCIWVMTFDPAVADRISRLNTNVIAMLSDILSESVKEKVTRIILATFRNLLEKPSEREYKTDNALAMVQCKVLKQLQLLEGRKIEDQDLVEDIQFLNETLQASVQDLSSFDEYCSEVKSGRLEWSPVHKSEKFWHENAPRLNEKNFELLKILVRLLETNKDPLILSVAAHDIGEFVRHYPRGKNVIEQLGGKQFVMTLLTHEDPNVRYEALLAVQKLMVHNWEYLGRQLDEPGKDAAKEGGTATTATGVKA
jgi:V-type H+-transporting ATPase subunit H